jgi:hypothetical protein
MPGRRGKQKQSPIPESRFRQRFGGRCPATDGEKVDAPWCLDPKQSSGAWGGLPGVGGCWGGLGPFEGRRDPFAEVVIDQHRDIVAGAESGATPDGEQLVVTHDETDPHVDRQDCEFFDDAAVGR